MTFALWCVLLAAMLPLLLTGAAKAGDARERGGAVDNHTPRESAARLTGRWARLHAAHLNAFEAFPFFAVAVLVAEGRGVPQGLVNALAGSWVLARLGHAGAYYADAATPRSVLWAVAWLAAAALLTSPGWG